MVFPLIMNPKEFRLVHKKSKVVSTIIFLSIWKESEIYFCEYKRILDMQYFSLSHAHIPIYKTKMFDKKKIIIGRA